MVDPALPTALSASASELRVREAGENFPVALRLLPAGIREELHAVYAFARTVDDLGDRAEGDRTALLTAFGEDLARVWSTGEPELPVHRRLVPVVRRHGLAEQDFTDLVRANLQDQEVSRYDTFEDLLGYCRLSADPVGHIVLDLFGAATPRRREHSDRVCTALQLLEHWQDVGEDARAGRVYLPQKDLQRHRVGNAELKSATASTRLRGLVLAETDRATQMLDEGAALVGELDGWARVAVAGFVAGGRAAAASIRRCGGDVLAAQATPRKVDLARYAAAELARSVRPRRFGGAA